jgi:hypothetical protein
MWAANRYTDGNGTWLLLAVMALAGVLLYRNAAAARFITRHVTGPIRGMPGYDRLQAFNDGRAWFLFVRFILGLWSGALLVVCLLALIGWLPDG